MDQHYKIEQGKLTPVPQRQGRGLLLLVCTVLLTLLAGSLGFLTAEKRYALPENSIIITEKEYERYIEVEQALAEASKNATTLEYVLSFEQLNTIFDQVFSDVSLDDDRKQHYLASVSQWAAHYSVPPLLVLSIIWRESFYDEKLVSTANARGPMQVIYKYHTAKLTKLGKAEQDLHDIDTGIRIGVEILREYFDKNDRNIFKALFAYVGGEHRRYAQDILNRYFNARIYIEEQL